MLRFKFAFTVCIVLSVCSLWGCALRTSSSVPGPTAAPEFPDGSGWWNVNFAIDWPAGKPPAWHVDLYLAHQLVAPLLQRYGRQIELWRFHRRAARDASGHQFSFIFYSQASCAQHIFDALADDRRITALIDAHVLLNFRTDDTTAQLKGDLAATSDASWSQPLQRAWPYYIMGVSRMWLALIEQFAPETQVQAGPAAPAAQPAAYQPVQDRVQQVWRDEGSHALLHHLNALFAYSPLTVYEKRQLQF